MKKLVFGTAVAGAAVLGFLAVARDGRKMCAEHCGESCGRSSQREAVTHGVA